MPVGEASMNVRRARSRCRRGAAAVETALVLILATSMIFGVFEYCRLIMDWNLLNNAAREGCRYALVHNTAGTISTDVQTTVTNFMGGETASYTNFTVTVSGTHNGTNTTVNNLAAGDLITVTVSGKYKFMNIVPLVTMPSLTLTSAVTMVCEGGT
jgi:Flp pilus assembly protein TadG